MRLASKSIQIDTWCQWCRVHHETDIHTLFECEIAGATWAAVGLQTKIDIMQDDSAFDVIRRIFDTCNGEQCSLLAMV